MSRIDQLPEDALEEAVRQLERDIEEIKGIQFMGADVLVPKVNVTGNTYDYDSVDDGFGTQVIQESLTFASDNQPNVFATMAVKFYNDAGTELTQAFFTRMFTAQSTELPNNFTAGFGLFAEEAGGTPFHAKVYILATDTGTITL